MRKRARADRGLGGDGARVVPGREAGERPVGPDVDVALDPRSRQPGQTKSQSAPARATTASTSSARSCRAVAIASASRRTRVR